MDLFCLLLAVAMSQSCSLADDASLTSGLKALEAREYQKAVEHFSAAIAKDPKNYEAYWFRGAAYDKLGRLDVALVDCDKALELMPEAAGVFNVRGAVQFKRGKFKESLDDFDKYLQAFPKEKAGHWQRGITCYYAGRYEEGYKQFEAYEKVDTNDVENAVWHYLCLAKHTNAQAARKKLLKIGQDQRLPMMEVYELFAGKCKPEDVLKACAKAKGSPEKYNRALFYAHLYLGLYYDVHGEPQRALEHLNEATEKHRIEHYMWDVARVHRDMLKK
jgi:lipoprotein NlpI